MTNGDAARADDVHSVTSAESTCPDIEMGVIVGNAAGESKLPDDILMAPKQVEGMHQMAEQYAEPPGACFKCCCPPCAVLVHEGVGAPLVVSLLLGCFYTMFCWKPKQGEKS